MMPKWTRLSTSPRRLWIACVVLIELSAVYFFLRHVPPLHEDAQSASMRLQSSPNLRQCISARHRDTRFVNGKRCVTPSDRMAAIAELVFEVKEMLERLQVVYWVDSGTLLGQYRMEEVIPWDLDGDVGIFDDGFEKLRTTELKISSGYELNVWNSSIYTRHDRGPDLPARLIDTTYGFYVDIFVFSPSLNSNGGESMVGPLPSLAWNSCARCRVVNPEGESTTKVKLKRFVVPLNWIVPTQRCSLNDFYVMCPAQPVPYLQELYGEEFLNPIVW